MFLSQRFERIHSPSHLTPHPRRPLTAKIHEAWQRLFVSTPQLITIFQDYYAKKN